MSSILDMVTPYISKFIPGQEAPTPAPAVPPMAQKADGVPSWVWMLGAGAAALYLLGFFGKKR